MKSKRPAGLFVFALSLASIATFMFEKHLAATNNVTVEGSLPAPGSPIASQRWRAPSVDQCGIRPSETPSAQGRLSSAEYQEHTAKVARARSLRQKVVMSEEEQRAFHTLLSSEELLESVAVLLEGEGDALHTPETRIARMEAVDVLGEAIAWRENPRRGVALSIARNAVLSENYHAVSSTWLKQDLVGDKLELIEVLRSEAPEELTRIVETAKEHGSNIGPVLRYAGLKG